MFTCAEICPLATARDEGQIISPARYTRSTGGRLLTISLSSGSVTIPPSFPRHRHACRAVTYAFASAGGCGIVSAGEDITACTNIQGDASVVVKRGCDPFL